MEIRLATLDDIENLCNLVTEFFAYNAKLQPNICNAAIENGKYLEVVIQDEQADIFIAVDNGDIVGFMHIMVSATPPYDSLVQHKFVEIMAFMVTASCRRKNIGSKLMDAAAEWGKARNLEYIELVALANAEAANAFYQHYGFKTEAHVMRRSL